MHKFARHLGLIAACSLVALSMTSPAWGNPLPPPPWTNGMEFSIETDKSVYSLGEQVLATYFVHNPTDQDFVWTFNTDPGLFLWVHQDTEEIWLNPMAVKLMFSAVTIPAQDTFELEWLWNLTDKDNLPVAHGLYTLTAGPTPTSNEAISTEITVIPEPATALLLGSAWIGFLLKRRQRR